MGMAENISIPVNVGVVLDLDSDLDGKIALSCIEMALSDFYATHGDYKTRLVLNTRDSMKDVVGAAAAALDLIKKMEVHAILGPTTSMQANFVIELGEKAQVPIISFSASSPSLTSIRSPFFFRATQNDSTQVNAISALVQVFGWREAVPIYIDNEYGEGIIPYLTDALQAVDARVPYRSVISPSATDDQIVAELYKLKTMQTRVFIVHMYGSLGTRLFAKAKEIGMMSEGYVWIMTDGLTADLLSSPNPSVTETIQGVLGVKPYVPNTKEIQDFRVRWKRKFQLDNPYIIDAELNIYGLRGYDAATALALAVEKSGTKNFGFRKANVSSSSSTDLATDISLNGPNLLQALSNTSFKGLTGDYHFVKWQLQPSAFQIVNVNGNGGRGTGFWTPTKGLVKQLVPSNVANSTSLSGISTVIFPGDPAVAPKGWVNPTEEKKLRIGVPLKSSFKQFVEVKKYPSSNTTNITGFCIDVFDAAVKALPYDLPYEYVPFAKPDGEPAGTYNDLVYQVYLKNFDAVVGDVTIVYTRSLYVDYTLPFMESGVSIIVPIESHTTEKCLSYTASLSSLLTIQRLKVADVNELVNKGEYVGYQKGSSVLGILLGMGFDKSKILEYKSPEECHELFSKGSGNGGIAAAFDEIPYIRLLMPKYRSKYTVIDLSFKMGGFGFVFPKGSPDVSNISREILNMIEGDKMKDLQDKWFGDQTSPDSGTSVSSNSLSIKTFWGLFLIAGIASLFALIIFMVMFVHQEGRVVLRPSDSTTSIWSKIRHLFSIFNQRDFTSHIEMNGRNGIHFPSNDSHGHPSSSECDSGPNSQTPKDVVIFADQLTNPNLEVTVKENQKSNVNHQTPTRTDQRCNAVIHRRSKSY
ncbi:GLUTAMATE RECEPTOR 2.9 [Salix viminalis]|uniref:Glutamate receptor n=1 Tax=Salix viminalis TaxID=40686 RepID=A0A9Q0NQ21_SALVM|nr:GLUTAMATE RECEPTOR 2.9 [Salix viminalis]